MKNNFAKRKKKFWALCLVLAMVLVQVVPIDVKAKDYTMTGANGTDPQIDSLNPGDRLIYNNGYNNIGINVFYYGEDGSKTNGVDNSPLKVTYDSPATILTFSDVTNTGNPDAFKEWKVEKISYDSSNGTLSVKLYAVFYTESSITYELNGGANASGNPSVYYEGKETITLGAPTKTGHTGSWYSDAALTTKVTKIPTTQTGPVTLYAKYTPKTYGITYDLDGGSNGAGNPTGYTYGVGVTGFEAASKSGYTFEGWYSDATYRNRVISISASETGDIKLYAKFSGNEYTITYDLDGGSNGTENPTGYTCGEGVASFEDASKPGYTFEGWYRDAAYRNRVTSISASETRDIKLYAKFTANSYGITYDLDGGSNGAGNPTGYTYGVGVTGFEAASKEGYTFEGWYRDTEFKTEVTSISATEMGDIKLYAKFSGNEYTITYDLDGGSNGTENPTGYTCGEGVASFEDASRDGYTFEGWYTEATFENQVISISATEIGDIKLYAKFSGNAYNITYELDEGSNGAENPTSYTCGEGVASFADAAKEDYTFEGWYKEATFENQVTSISATEMGDITLYAKFKKIIRAGEGTISVDDVYYGEEISPVVKSATNGTDHVTIQYKQKDAADNTYTDVKPNEVGNYTARAIFAETDDYFQVVATDDFSIGYLTVPEPPYQINGTKGKNDFYTSDVTIVPTAGFLISDSLTGAFREQIALSTTTEKFSAYLKKADTGAITSAIDAPEIKIDKVAPVISGAQSGETIYDDEVKMDVKDENLSQILVNGETVTFEKGKATLNLSSNQGEEKYEIVAVDLAGNRSSKQVVVSAEWMKSKVIPEGTKVRLYTNYSYTLGGGKWKISGDSTTYNGNTAFYVNSEGNYSFSQAN